MKTMYRYSLVLLIVMNINADIFIDMVRNENRPTTLLAKAQLYYNFLKTGTQYFFGRNEEQRFEIDEDSQKLLIEAGVPVECFEVVNTVQPRRELHGEFVSLLKQAKHIKEKDIRDVFVEALFVGVEANNLGNPYLAYYLFSFCLDIAKEQMQEASSGIMSVFTCYPLCFTPAENNVVKNDAIIPGQELYALMSHIDMMRGHYIHTDLSYPFAQDVQDLHYPFTDEVVQLRAMIAVRLKHLSEVYKPIFNEQQAYLIDQLAHLDCKINNMLLARVFKMSECIKARAMQRKNKQMNNEASTQNEQPA